MSNFRTFQVLKTEKSNFRTFQDFSGPVGTLLTSHVTLKAIKFPLNNNNNNLIFYENPPTCFCVKLFANKHTKQQSKPNSALQPVDVTSKAKTIK